jgi:hypothetical protein
MGINGKKSSLFCVFVEILEHIKALNPNILFLQVNVGSASKLYVGNMGLSGMFSIALATKLKYDTIYLLGYDFGTNSIKNTNTHFYQDTISVVSGGVKNPGIYLTDTGVKKEVKLFDHFLQFRSKIYNVNPTSNIQSYEKITYNDFFNKIA